MSVILSVYVPPLLRICLGKFSQGAHWDIYFDRASFKLLTVSLGKSGCGESRTELIIEKY